MATVTLKERRFALAMDGDVAAPVRVGVSRSTKVGRRFQRDLLSSFRRGLYPQMGIDTEEITKLLSQAMVYAYLRARIRVFETAPIQISLADPFRKSVNFMQTRLKMSQSDLKSLSDKYSSDALLVVRKASEKTEKALQKTLLQTQLAGEHVSEGMKALRRTFEAQGMTDVASHQLEAVFRTQTQLAYAAGQHSAYSDPFIDEALWGFKYVTVGDVRVRPQHKAMEGVQLQKNDAFWKTNSPPNGWNCRCTAIPIYDPDTKSVPPPGPQTIDGIPNVVGTADRGFAFHPSVLDPLSSAGRVVIRPSNILKVPNLTTFESQAGKRLSEEDVLNSLRIKKGTPQAFQAVDMDIDTLTDLFDANGLGLTKTNLEKFRASVRVLSNDSTFESIEALRKAAAKRTLNAFGGVKSKPIRITTTPPSIAKPKAPVTAPKPIIPEPVVPVSNLDTVLPWQNLASPKDVQSEMSRRYRINFLHDGYGTGAAAEKKIVELGNFVGEQMSLINEFPGIRAAIKEGAATNFRWIDLDILNAKTVPTSSGRALGVYRGSDRSISIATKSRPVRISSKPRIGGRNTWVTDDSLGGTIRHEIGHGTQSMNTVRSRHWRTREFLPRENRWGDVSKQILAEEKRTGKSLISKYAQKNLEELYAESFATFTHPKYGTAGVKRLPRAIEEHFELTLGPRSTAMRAKQAASTLQKELKVIEDRTAALKAQQAANKERINALTSTELSVSKKIRTTKDLVRGN